MEDTRKTKAQAEELDPRIAVIVEQDDKNIIVLTHGSPRDVDTNQYKALGGTFDGRAWTFPGNREKAIAAVIAGQTKSAELADKPKAKAAAKAAQVETPATPAQADKPTK